jgi:ADP-heptose:LPS heptosyltransferase
MKIAVFRALQLGDLLCAVPALRALKGEYPAARVTLIGLPWARQFVERFQRYVDAFIEFPGFPGLPERTCDAAALPAFFDRTRAAGFDLALQMHGSGEIVNTLLMLMGPRRLGGFYRIGHWCPDPERFVDWQEREHEVLRYLRLLSRIGVPQRGTHLEFPVGAADHAEQRALGLGNYVCIHPGSQLASRRWPAERFAEVGDALAQGGCNVVLTGTAAEAPLTRQVAAAMRHAPIDLAGRTSLGTLGAVIARARLLVCNDTGVSHIAAALRTPSVVICSGADPQRWAPLDRQLHRVLAHDVPCRPCAHADCPIGHPCAVGVTPEQVLKQINVSLECAA